MWNADKFYDKAYTWTAAHGFEDTRLLLQERIMKDIKDAGIKLVGMP